MKIRIGFLIFFLLIACSKDETTTSSSTNETSWRLSNLEMKRANSNEWVSVTFSEISENLVINDLAQVMTRTVSGSECTLTLIYNFRWNTEGMVFDGYNADSDPYNCQPSILHCPDNYETLTTSTFTFEGFMSDDERTLRVICSPGSDQKSYRYTYTK